MVNKVLQVGYLNPIKNYGGVEKYILNLTKSLNSTYGATIDILCADKTSGILKSNFGSIISLKVPIFGNERLFFVSKCIYGKMVRNYIDQHFNEYDAIHFHGDSGLIGNNWSKRSVLTLHGVAKNTSTVKKRIISFLPALIEKNNVKKARAIFSISSEAREFFIKYNKEIQTIKQSVDTSLYHNLSKMEKQTARDKMGIQDDIIVGTIIGRDPKRKGLRIAIEAVVAVGDPKLRLFAIGFPKEERASNVVKFTGDIDEETKLSYLAASNFFIFPSMKEGFPISVLEAAMMGLPLIVSKQSGVSELADLVPFFREIESADPRDYASALKDLIEFYSRKRSDESNSNLHKIDQYSLANSAHIYMAAYQNLANFGKL